MALPDYQDENGNPIPPPEPDPPAAPSAPQPNRKQQIVDGFILPYFAEKGYGSPSQADIDELYDIYERFGGDALRQRIDTRFGSAKAPGADWFSKNAPPGFGAPPEAFGETYSAGTYTPPTFTEPFVAPTADSLSTDPGYQARLAATQRGAERTAAARGSILSGGFVGETLPRKLGEFASNEYGNAFRRAFDTYQQRYGQFSDAAAREAEAFRTNETGKLNQFSTRYRSYQDLVAGRRQSEIDRWNREMELARLGLDAASAGR